MRIKATASDRRAEEFRKAPKEHHAAGARQGAPECAGRRREAPQGGGGRRRAPEERQAVSERAKRRRGAPGGAGRRREAPECAGERRSVPERTEWRGRAPERGKCCRRAQQGAGGQPGSAEKRRRSQESARVRRRTFFPIASLAQALFTCSCQNFSQRPRASLRGLERRRAEARPASAGARGQHEDSAGAEAGAKAARRKWPRRPAELDCSASAQKLLRICIMPFANPFRAVKFCPDPGSNWGPSDLQSDALPTELSGLMPQNRQTCSKAQRQEEQLAAHRSKHLEVYTTY